jgi:hypothetical protein
MKTTTLIALSAVAEILQPAMASRPIDVAVV